MMVDMSTREILAAGWRNLWNIARMLDSKQEVRNKRLSCYTMNDYSDSDTVSFTDQCLPFDIASVEDDYFESKEAKAERYEKYRN